MKNRWYSQQRKAERLQQRQRERDAAEEQARSKHLARQSNAGVSAQRVPSRQATAVSAERGAAASSHASGLLAAARDAAVAAEAPWPWQKAATLSCSDGVSSAGNNCSDSGSAVSAATAAKAAPELGAADADSDADGSDSGSDNSDWQQGRRRKSRSGKKKKKAAAHAGQGAGVDGAGLKQRARPPRVQLQRQPRQQAVASVLRGPFRVVNSGLSGFSPGMVHGHGAIPMGGFMMMGGPRSGAAVSAGSGASIAGVPQPLNPYTSALQSQPQALSIAQLDAAARAACAQAAGTSVLAGHTPLTTAGTGSGVLGSVVPTVQPCGSTSGSSLSSSLAGTGFGGLPSLQSLLSGSGTQSLPAGLPSLQSLLLGSGTLPAGAGQEPTGAGTDTASTTYAQPLQHFSSAASLLPAFSAAGLDPSWLSSLLPPGSLPFPLPRGPLTAPVALPAPSNSLAAVNGGLHGFKAGGRSQAAGIAVADVKPALVMPGSPDTATGTTGSATATLSAESSSSASGSTTGSTGSSFSRASGSATASGAGVGLKRPQSAIDAGSLPIGLPSGGLLGLPQQAAVPGTAFGQSSFSGLGWPLGSPASLFGVEMPMAGAIGDAALGPPQAKRSRGYGIAGIVPE